MGRAKSDRNGNLPPRMLARRRRRATYYFYATPGVDRAEIPLGCDLPYALRQYHAMNEGGTRGAVPGGAAKALHRAVMKNATPKGIEVTITIEDIQAMLDASGNRCSVTGLPFDSTQYSGHRIRPWMPSIDRIVAGGAYSRENTRLVCAAVNLAMNQFGEAAFLKIAASTIARKRILRNTTQKRGSTSV